MMERKTRIELALAGWKPAALPLSYIRMNWHEWGGSNTRPSELEAAALPLSYTRVIS
jgi:hypothetical protein